MVSRNVGNEITKVLMSFVDYLFQKTPYQIYEKPKYSKSVNLKEGYRLETRTLGEDRKKSINWEFKLITPSRTEIENSVSTWILKNGLTELPTGTEDWSKVVQDFMDDFIQTYLIMERPHVSKDSNYSLGYRPSTERVDSKVNFFLKFVQPSRDELVGEVDNWLKRIGG
jgi:hypothetical protein